MENGNLSQLFLESVTNVFQSQKRMAEAAVEQISDETLHASLDPNTNCIAVIMKHVSGNLLSRWTDFLTSDGEKSWRQRDDEFIDTFRNRAELLAYWEQGWQLLPLLNRGNRRKQEKMRKWVSPRRSKTFLVFRWPEFMRSMIS